MATIAEGAGAIVLISAPDDAVDILNSRQFNAVIIDYALGAECSESLRQAAFQAGHQKVLVALSAQERRLLGKPSEAGFSGHLVRPVRSRSLIDCIMPRAIPAMPAKSLPVAMKGEILRVLVAEDNEINALIVLKTLERHGFQAIWARDGREALALAASSFKGMDDPFDLILMDVRMPEMDGLEATRKLRLLEAEIGMAQRMPIIGISANVASEDVAEARAAGMDDCLAKPLDREHLFRWLTKISAAKRNQNAA